MRIKFKCLIAAAVTIAVLVVVMSTIFSSQRIFMSQEKIKLPRIKDVPAETWQTLAQKKIFFAHMSVGNNILDGIRAISKDNSQIDLNILDMRNPGDFDRPALAHAKLGHNTDPLAKLESFRNMIDSIGLIGCDIVFLKFCYVDINRTSRPADVFAAYKDTLNHLKEKYPHTIFLHWTVPICSGPVGFKRQIKSRVKTILGRPGAVDDNSRRNEYNVLLKDAFADEEHIFDVAMVESTHPDGSACYATKGGRRIPMMYADYTDDGGHLNALGRRIVAEQLLIKLATMPNEQ